MTFRDRLARLIAWCEHEIALMDRGGEDAMFRSGFLNLTVISVIAVAIDAVLTWWL